MTTTFDDQTRRELRAALEATQVRPERAVQAVDLACHAAARGVDTLFDACRAAPDAALMLMAIELSLQLARARMLGILERTHELGAASGAPQARSEVSMRL